VLVKLFFKSRYIDCVLSVHGDAIGFINYLETMPLCNVIFKLVEFVVMLLII